MPPKAPTLGKRFPQASEVYILITTRSASNLSPLDAPTPEQISRVAQQEGGPSKGSQSAQMQSQLGKQLNAEGGASGGSAALQGTTITPEHVSQVAQQEGGTTKGSESARLQSQMTKQRNEGA